MYSIPDFAGKDGSGSNLKGAGGFTGMSSGQNQYANYPSMVGGSSTMPSVGGPLDAATPQTGGTPPGIVPPTGGYTPPSGTGGFDVGTAGVGARLPGQMYQSRTIDPSFTSALDQWLRSQLGKGATPLDLSAIMPSTGEATK